jgi:hypothetical protein
MVKKLNSMKKNISNNNYTAGIVLFTIRSIFCRNRCSNAAVGSAPTNNKPALNSLFEFAMISNKGVEITVGYESFKAIKFEKYNIRAGYQFQILERVKIIPSVSYN